jgi:hypothetical protein
VAFFKTIEAVRVLILSGLLVLIMSLLIMSSCRCVPAKGPIAAIRRAPWFSKLFSRHCVMWLVFVLILAVHVVFALGFTGNPF